MRRLLLRVFIVAILAACGDPAVESDAPAAAPVATASPTSVTPPPEVVVPDSLAFSASQVGGGTLDLAQYAGKPVLLWFWAPT